MSLEPNFILPEKQLDIRETSKRRKLIEWFAQAIDDCVLAMLVTGSMSYGYDYSVKESSDIDMQLLTTPEKAGQLRDFALFNSRELDQAITGYQSGVFQQFSLVFEKDGVPMECHFWDAEA